MSDDEILTECEKALRSHLGLGNPLPYRWQRFSELARKGAAQPLSSGVEKHGMGDDSFVKHLRELADKHMDGKLETELSAALHNAAGTIVHLSASPFPAVDRNVVLEDDATVERVAMAIYEARWQNFRPLWREDWPDREFDKGDKDMAYHQARAALAALHRTGGV